MYLYLASFYPPEMAQILEILIQRKQGLAYIHMLHIYIYIYIYKTCIVNTIAADGPRAQEAHPSTVEMLVCFPSIIIVPRKIDHRHS